MALEVDDEDQEDGKEEAKHSLATNGKPGISIAENEEGSEDDDEEEEPRLKYASLTKHLKQVYRNGDATSAFLVAGDKMVSLLGYLGMRRGD